MRVVIKVADGKGKSVDVDVGLLVAEGEGVAVGFDVGLFVLVAAGVVVIVGRSGIVACGTSVVKVEQALIDNTNRIANTE